MEVLSPKQPAERTAGTHSSGPASPNSIGGAFPDLFRVAAADPPTESRPSLSATPHVDEPDRPESGAAESEGMTFVVAAEPTPERMATWSGDSSPVASGASVPASDPGPAGRSTVESAAPASNPRAPMLPAPNVGPAPELASTPEGTSPATPDARPPADVPRGNAAPTPVAPESAAVPSANGSSPPASAAAVSAGAADPVDRVAPGVIADSPNGDAIRPSTPKITPGDPVPREQPLESARGAAPPAAERVADANPPKAPAAAANTPAPIESDVAREATRPVVPRETFSRPATAPAGRAPVDRGPAPAPSSSDSSSSSDLSDRPRSGAALDALRASGRESSRTMTTEPETFRSPAPPETGIAPEGRTSVEAVTVGAVNGATSIAPSDVPSAAPAAASPATPPPVMLTVAPGLEAQLAAKAREYLESGKTELRISLDPPSLGRLRVRLELSEGRAVAHIVATSPEAAAILTREREDLLRAFQQQGFEHVDVHVDSDADSAARSRHGWEQDDDGPSDGSAPSPDGTVRFPRRANLSTTQRVDLFV